jgi:hypothetical protein
MRSIRITDLESMDKDLTVGDLLKNLKEKSQKEEESIKERDVSIVSTYTESFLKRVNPDRIFGETLEVLHIGRIQYSTMDTSWNRLYSIESGTLLTFSKRDIGLINQSGQTTYSEKELNEFEIISVEEFREFSKKFSEIKGILTSFIRQEDKNKIQKNLSKEELIPIVERVRSKRQEHGEIFDAVTNYINTSENFSYEGVFKILDELTSPKLGGRAIYVNTVIEFLKSEIKAENKKKKNQ